MIILSAKNIVKTYGVQAILTNVSFHVNQGDRVGIVGANGAGKTTLLNILSGRMPYDSGDFFVSNDTTIGYLRQSDNFNSEKTVYEEMLSIFNPLIEMEKELNRMSHEISRRSSEGEDVERLLHQYDDMLEEFKNKNGYGYKSEINGILTSMAFTKEFFDKRISLLSGGERTRLALAALLLKKPDLLLLDEPTNHLDIGTLKWLEQYLKAYSGTIMLISHDRYFLDQIANKIIEIEQHELFTYEGNYSDYTNKKRLREADELRKYDAQQKEIKRQEEIIRRFKQHGTEKLAKRAQSREKRLQNIELVEKPKIHSGSMKIHFKESLQSGNDVLFAKDIAKSFGHGLNRRQLFQRVDLDIKRGERICLVGPNGIGKTTLLKIIMGEVTPDMGYIKLGHNVEFGYYDQEQKLLNYSSTVLDEVHSAYRLYNETELRSLLGRFLFKDDSVFQTVSSLSGGEKARLSLLKLMLSGANLLVMDEPTNHLDIASKEVFEEALTDFPGTLIVVSHDRYFLNRVPTRIIELTVDGIENFLGGYDYYMEKKESIKSVKGYLDELSTIGHSEKAKEANQLIGSTGNNQDEKELTAMEVRLRNKELQAQQRRTEREKKRLEETIEELEIKISQIEHNMCQEEIFSDHEKLLELDNQLKCAKEELSAAYDAWMELNEA